MKSNIEYLKERLLDDDESMDFLEGVISDHETEITDLENENEQLNKEKEELEKNIGDLELQMVEYENNYDEIDCGIGTIKYVTDNIKLECIMDDFKEKMQYKFIAQPTLF